GGGLEALALRRGYGGRQKGSLTDVAEALYAMIRAGKDDLTRTFNLNKKSRPVDEATQPRLKKILRRKRKAEERLREAIDARNLHPDALLMAYLVRAEDVRLEEAPPVPAPLALAA